MKFPAVRSFGQAVVLGLLHVAGVDTVIAFFVNAARAVLPWGKLSDSPLLGALRWRPRP
jgi:hypothetical protein